MTETKFPKDWDEARVRRVLEHAESQSEEEAMPQDQTFGPPEMPGAPTQVDVSRIYRTFWRRFWASGVDGLVFLPMAIGDHFFLAANRSAAILLIWGTVSYSAFWVYSVSMHARFGQTLGKMATGVRVLDISESRIPSMKQAFLRDSPYIVASVASGIYFYVLVLSGTYSGKAELEGPALAIGIASLAWLILELISMLTNKRRRALHDLLAGTVVTRASDGERI